MHPYKIIHNCRVCSSTQLQEALKFEPQYIASTFVESNHNHPMAKVKIPMTVLLCGNCGLVQLAETVHPDLLYRNYFYRTAVNDTMRGDLNDVVCQAIEQGHPSAGDCIVDIGANDCTMIGMFPATFRRIAVEPAKNIRWDHVDPSIHIINDYFSQAAVFHATGRKKIKVLTSTAMFYDLDNPNAAAHDIKALLDSAGVCIIQVSYLYCTIRDMNFYDICHEHLEYYSLETLNNLMEQNGLSIFDARVNCVNGGSLRVAVAHTENVRQRSGDFHRLLAEEQRLQLKSLETYRQFGHAIDTLAKRSHCFIAEEIRKGGKVIGLGASTKGNVLLQLCGITRDMVPYISERNPEKVGLRTLGTDIEIISEKDARRLNPSCVVVIPWNFKEEILRREKDYLDRGGKMLFLMPYPYYIDTHGETKLA